MHNGVPLVERVKRLIEQQMTILESWVAPGSPEGLSVDQLDQLKTLAMIVRQLDLDSVDTTPTGPAQSVEDLLASLPSKK